MQISAINSRNLFPFYLISMPPSRAGMSLSFCIFPNHNELTYLLILLFNYIVCAFHVSKTSRFYIPIKKIAWLHSTLSIKLENNKHSINTHLVAKIVDYALKERSFHSVVICKYCKRKSKKYPSQNSSMFLMTFDINYLLDV